MKICFPADKPDGRRYVSAEEMMGLIGREPHGSWLAGDNVDTAVPLPCMADGEGKESTFNAMSCIVLKDGGKILPREACHPLTDKDGKTWFEVNPRSWMSQDDVKELYNAVHHPEMGIRDIAARLVVKHDSEWFDGSHRHRWNVFFQNYDRV